MATVKAEVLELLQSLPDDCTFEDIKYLLYLKEVTERGLVPAGKAMPLAEVRGQMELWLKPTGQGSEETITER